MLPDNRDVVRFRARRGKTDCFQGRVKKSNGLKKVDFITRAACDYVHKAIRLPAGETNRPTVNGSDILYTAQFRL